MPTDATCDARAQLCETVAGECLDPRLAAEWLAMADEWRLAASDPANDNDGHDG